jgi:hypothetical protein
MNEIAQFMDALIIFVVSIFIGLLLVKVWGMANDVKDLKVSTETIRDVLLKKEGITAEELSPKSTDDGWS